VTIAAYSLTCNNAAAATSANTASIAPTGGRLVLAWVNTGRSGGGTQPTLSGCGLTWDYVNTVLRNNYRLSFFRACGASPSSGVVTIDFAGVSNVSAWAIVEYSGTAATTAANGSDGIVQSAANSGGAGANSLAVTLASFADAANNVAVGGFGTGGVAARIYTADTSPSGYAILAQTWSATDAGRNICSEWHTGEDTSVGITWDGGTLTDYMGIAAELAILAAASGVPDRGTSRGLARGIARGLANAREMVRDVSGLLVPKDRRLVIPVELDLAGA